MAQEPRHVLDAEATAGPKPKQSGDPLWPMDSLVVEGSADGIEPGDGDN